MAWRLAPAIATLKAECDWRWPNRSKVHDGTIGDEAHQSRVSDHNPDDNGDVCAMDITHDRAHGVDIAPLFEQLRQRARDGTEPRIAYLIFNWRICSAGRGWVWRIYDGAPHNEHGHLSIRHTQAAKTDTRPWFPWLDTQEDDDVALTDEEHVWLQEVKNKVELIRGTADNTERFIKWATPILEQIAAHPAAAAAAGISAAEVADELGRRLTN